MWVTLDGEEIGTVGELWSLGFANWEKVNLPVAVCQRLE